MSEIGCATTRKGTDKRAAALFYEEDLKFYIYNSVNKILAVEKK